MPEMHMQSIEELHTTTTATTKSQFIGNGDVSILELLTVLGQRKKLIAWCLISCGVIGAIIAFAIPAKYTATAVILPPQTSSLSSTMLSQVASLGALASVASSNLGLKNPNDLQVALLRSRTVEDAMIRRFDLQRLYKKKRLSDTRKKLESNLEIENGQKDGLIRISLDDWDPLRAAAMTNGYVEEYKKLTATLAIGEASQRRLFFEQQLEQAKNDLAEAEEQLKITEQKTGVIHPDSQARALLESVAVLRGQIAAKEVELQSLSLSSTTKNPNFLVAQQQLETLRSQLAQLAGSGSQGDDGIIPKGKVPEAALEYVRKLREVKYHETLFEILARQYEIAKLDEAKQGGVVQVVDAAIAPDRRSSPQRALIIIGAIFAGLLISVSWTLLSEASARAELDPARSRQMKVFKQSWTRKS